jgi:3-oxoacyl-[acyl-carrier protein] reductase
MSDNRVAVVTGGARGIGNAVVKQLAEGGYHTVILDNGNDVEGAGRNDDGPIAEAVEELLSLGLSVEGLLCDVTNTDAVNATASDILDRHGRVDVIVNPAGIMRPGPFLDDTVETWKALVSTHLGGHLNVVQAFVPTMIKQQSGHVVNFTSTSGLLGSRRQPAYSTAKEAIIGYTRYLAKHLHSEGIRVNVVSPAAETRMSYGHAKEASPSDNLPAMYSDRDAKFVGRFVRWLVDDDESITGRIFVVSGHYVTEYEHIRPWKWAALAKSSSPQEVEERMRWTIGRPDPSLIGTWPTRDFNLLEIERTFEGTKTGPNLIEHGRVNAAADRQFVGPLVVGIDDQRSQAITEHVNKLRAESGGNDVTMTAGDNLEASASGVVAVLPGSAKNPPEPDAKAASTESVFNIVNADEVCEALVETLRLLQLAIRTSIRDASLGAALVFPGWCPWLDPEAGPREWLLWYGAVGAVRGGAATRAIYGVRINGVSVASKHEANASQVLPFLLSAQSSWLNGYLLTFDQDGVGVLSDEKPKWQMFSGDAGESMPPGFVSQLDS